MRALKTKKSDFFANKSRFSSILRCFVVRSCDRSLLHELHSQETQNTNAVILKYLL
ncbi:hypothetical protein IQ270_05970 [Microcoleus sp. LEGE 07076]|uniref:hypothetical protein n=1 Tax=Microcoleus sp. LEGE 07076 TaxID=915322 RepID=UPI00187EFA8A|nr:hypothetical protein [Microcoleus sp. LEGE 07076]MBE9184280.1 hypothetical protein [Microcoleus sp. LEGE 07076]